MPIRHGVGGFTINSFIHSGLSGRPPCKSVAIGVARRGTRRSALLTRACNIQPLAKWACALLPYYPAGGGGLLLPTPDDDEGAFATLSDGEDFALARRRASRRVRW